KNSRRVSWRKRSPSGGMGESLPGEGGTQQGRDVSLARPQPPGNARAQPGAVSFSTSAQALQRSRSGRSTNSASRAVTHEQTAAAAKTGTQLPVWALR